MATKKKTPLLKPADFRVLRVKFGKELLDIAWFGPFIGIMGTAYKDSTPFFNLGDSGDCTKKEAIAYLEAVRKLTEDFVHRRKEKACSTIK